MKLYDERECKCRMVFKDKDGGLDDKKAFIHSKRWDLYVNEKVNLIKGGYSVKVVGYDGNKFLWEGVDDHAI